MEDKTYVRILIAAGIIGFFLILYVGVANAAGTVCQIANGCTGTGTAPSYGQLLVGNSSNGYSLLATSSLGISGGGSSASTTLLTDNNTFSGTDNFTNAASTWAGTWQSYSPSSFFSLSSWYATTSAAQLTTLANLSTVGTISSGVWHGTAIANAYLANSTISGVFLGSNLATLTCDGATLTCSSYNGSSGVSNWGVNLTHVNTWTGKQSFTAASTTNLTVNSGPVNANIPVQFYMASSSWGTGTTTIQFLYNVNAMTIENAVCKTSAGTLDVQLYHGTVNFLNFISASTTQGVTTYSSNGVLSTATTTYLDIGNAASSPTSLGCTFQEQYNGS